MLEPFGFGVVYNTTMFGRSLAHRFGSMGLCSQSRRHLVFKAHTARAHGFQTVDLGHGALVERFSGEEVLSHASPDERAAMHELGSQLQLLAALHGSSKSRPPSLDQALCLTVMKRLKQPHFAQ